LGQGAGQTVLAVLSDTRLDGVARFGDQRG
jgi:hypothetical protein